MTANDDAADLDGAVTWGELLDEAAARLASAGRTDPQLDARRIVAQASGHVGAALRGARGELVTQRAMASYDAMVARRAAGEPLQYVVGRWAFRYLDLAVDRRALIPRPETEVLVDLVLAHVDRLLAGRATSEPVTVVDLGTGSGAIALAVASERVRTSVWGTDRSADAIELARANLAGLGRAGARVRLAEGAWYDALDSSLRGAVDVVVSNPPYVATGDLLPDEVEAWEPPAALRSGVDGLDDLRVVVGEADAWLRPEGALAVELDPRQAATVAGWLCDDGWVDVTVARDLTGRDRFVHARRPA